MLMQSSNSNARPASARMMREAAALAAVNGIRSPSQVIAGQAPDQGVWDQSPDKIHPCPICGRTFARKYHVQSHFPACVGRNGNPNAARWDDAWNGGAAPVVAAPVVPAPVVPAPVVPAPVVPAPHIT